MGQTKWTELKLDILVFLLFSYTIILIVGLICSGEDLAVGQIRIQGSVPRTKGDF